MAAVIRAVAIAICLTLLAVATRAQPAQQPSAAQAFVGQVCSLMTGTLTELDLVKAQLAAAQAAAHPAPAPPGSDLHGAAPGQVPATEAKP